MGETVLGQSETASVHVCVLDSSIYSNETEAVRAAVVHIFQRVTAERNQATDESSVRKHEGHMVSGRSARTTGVTQLLDEVKLTAKLFAHD